MDPPRLTPFNPHKHLKEEYGISASHFSQDQKISTAASLIFVSNLTGSSVLEIAFLSAIVPALFLLRHCISSSSNTRVLILFARHALHASLIGLIYYRSSMYLSDVLSALEVKPKKSDNATVGFEFWMSCIITLVVDFLCVIVPVISIFTMILMVLSEWTRACAICLVLVLILCIIAKRFLCSNSYGNESLLSSSSIRMSLSSYRVSVVLVLIIDMIVTCICILAVDFKIYPRRYAKTETFGTGLLSCFLPRKWGDALQSISPLILLGFARLVVTTGVSYQVHVGEYGVHWNFFFTLAAVSILSTMINIRPQHCGILGASVLIGYQVSLKCGLNDYLLSNKREANLISQNKEGLFSIFGEFNFTFYNLFSFGKLV
ncbi:hypothetical protein ACLOJK_032721 [Asimina triloba]